MLSVFAPAKVNLHLAVGPLGPDGYHLVETVLQALAFGDTVTIAPGEPGFSCTPDMGLAPQENLAWRAALAMAERFGRRLDVSVAVEKRIPTGAGLGGGSADAAAVITGLAHLWDLEPDDDLAEVARSLGADVPFFLAGGAALFGGRGDVLERRLAPLEAPVVLIKPAASVSTGAAYAAFDRLGAQPDVAVASLAAALAAGDAGAVASYLHNAMQPSSSALVPEIADVLGLVDGHPGVLGAAMAGSGSCVFGICEDDAVAEACAASGRAAGHWAVATRTRPAGCEVLAG